MDYKTKETFERAAKTVIDAKDELEIVGGMLNDYIDRCKSAEHQLLQARQLLRKLILFAASVNATDTALGNNHAAMVSARMEEDIRKFFDENPPLPL